MDANALVARQVALDTMNVAAVEETLERLLFGHHDVKPATLLPTTIAKPISIACAVSRQLVTFVGGRVESMLLATEAHLQPASETALPFIGSDASDKEEETPSKVSLGWLESANESLRYTLKSMAFMSAGMTAFTAGIFY